MLKNNIIGVTSWLPTISPEAFGLMPLLLALWELLCPSLLASAGSFLSCVIKRELLVSALSSHAVLSADCCPRQWLLAVPCYLMGKLRSTHTKARMHRTELHLISPLVASEVINLNKAASTATYGQCTMNLKHSTANTFRNSLSALNTQQPVCYLSQQPSQALPGGLFTSWWFISFTSMIGSVPPFPHCIVSTFRAGSSLTCLYLTRAPLSGAYSVDRSGYWGRMSQKPWGSWIKGSGGL